MVEVFQKGTILSELVVNKNRCAFVFSSELRYSANRNAVARDPKVGSGLKPGPAR